MDKHLERAIALYKLRRHVEAERELHASLSADPGNFLVYALLSELISEQRPSEDAISFARKAIELAPDSSVGYQVLSVAQARMGRLPAAELSVRNALRIAPTDFDSLRILAAVLFDQSKWDSALDAARAGLRHTPTDSQCLDIVARSLDKLGQFCAADLTSQMALESNVESAAAHRLRGQFLIKRRQTSSARAHMLEAARLDPTNPENARCLEIVRGQSTRFYRVMRMLVPNWRCWRPAQVLLYFSFCALLAVPLISWAKGSSVGRLFASAFGFYFVSATMLCLTLDELAVWWSRAGAPWRFSMQLVLKLWWQMATALVLLVHAGVGFLATEPIVMALLMGNIAACSFLWAGFSSSGTVRRLLRSPWSNAGAVALLFAALLLGQREIIGFTLLGLLLFSYLAIVFPELKIFLRRRRRRDETYSHQVAQSYLCANPIHQSS